MAVEGGTIARRAPEYTDWWAKCVQVVRWLLVAVLLADIVAGLFIQPGRGTVTELRSDLANGNVRSVTFTDESQLGYYMLGQAGFPGDGDAVVVWRTGAVSYRVAELGNTSDIRSEIGRTARQRDVPVHIGPRDLLLGWPQLGLPIFLLLFVVMLLGGQPRLATRWATFWLLLTPLHAGMLRTLLRESPWSPAARARPEPTRHSLQPDYHRLTGGKAFVLLLLFTGAVRLALEVLQTIRF